jgi:capsular exopolysaccharide synthesis family protein
MAIEIFSKLKSALKDYQRRLLDEVWTNLYILKEEKSAEGIDAKAVVYVDPKSHVAEQYRIMRTNLRSLSPDQPLHSFAITSSVRGEGKTVTCCNLALAFAQETERKVILVDADLRKPAVHKIFNVSREPGLADILVDGVDINQFLSHPLIHNLYIIPAGKHPPNPSELIVSQRFRDIILRLKEKFNYVFFDCPPILPVTDAGVLGSQLDGTILIVKAAATGALDVERALSLLKDANAKPIGAVLTQVVSYIPYYLYRYRYVYVNKY